MTDNPTLESKLKAWIDNYYSEIAKRPQMFAATPQALENIVWILEEMRHELLAVAQASLENPYQAFLTTKGFESASFTSRGDGEEGRGQLNTGVTFEEFVDFLNDYLESRGRARHQREKKIEKGHRQIEDASNP